MRSGIRSAEAQLSAKAHITTFAGAKVRLILVLLFIQNSGVDRDHPATALLSKFPTDNVALLTVIAAFRLKQFTLRQQSLDQIRFLFPADDILEPVVFN